MRTFSKLMIAAAVAALPLAFMACSDDDDDSPSNTGGSGNGGETTGGTDNEGGETTGGSNTGGTSDGGNGGSGDTCPDVSDITEADCMAGDGPTDAILDSGVGAFTDGSDWVGDWVNWGADYDYPEVTDEETLDGATDGDLILDDDLTLDAEETYLLSGVVYVPDGVTLTIPAGTVIRGDSTTLGVLVIQRGGMIEAEGTASDPIVFTSNVASGPASGDWGGVVILGKAPNAEGDDVTIEGLAADEANQFGGEDEEDNSGTLSYVRLEYPGIEISEGNEINGLSLGSVGSGTTIDHLSIIQPQDDGIEFFGGTVDVSELVVLDPGDDMFDTDDGYQGSLTNLFGRHGAPVSGDPNGFEWDGTDDYSGSIQTIVSATNVTMCADSESTAQLAMLLRRGVEATLTNVVTVGFPDGVDTDESTTTQECVEILD